MKYKITYIPTHDPEDICKVWVEASSKETAKSQVKREYWDVKDIVCITQL